MVIERANADSALSAGRTVATSICSTTVSTVAVIICDDSD